MSFKKFFFYIKLCIVALTIGLFVDAEPFSIQKALAHPHVFIVQKVTVFFDDKGISGIRFRWRFDEMFSEMIVGDFDVNHNKKLEPAEVEEVKKNAFDYISNYEYFTFIKVNGKKYAFKKEKDFSAYVDKKNRLLYEFTVPVDIKARQNKQEIIVASYDPSYYSAIFFTRKTPLTLVNDDPFEVYTAVRKDETTKIYFDQVSPWAVYIDFNLKAKG